LPTQAAVELKNEISEKKLKLPSDLRQFVLYRHCQNDITLISTYESLKYDDILAGFNSFREGTNRQLGIITCGIAYNYLWRISAIEIQIFPF